MIHLRYPFQSPPCPDAELGCPHRERSYLLPLCSLLTGSVGGVRDSVTRERRKSVSGKGTSLPVSDTSNNTRDFSRRTGTIGNYLAAQRSNEVVIPVPLEYMAADVQRRVPLCPDSVQIDD
jgi:hypothetical protein